METKGSLAFHRYLVAHELGERAAAERFGVSHATINYWRSGKRRPSDVARDIIESVTGGAVRAIWWRTDEELERAKTFRPKRVR